MKPTHENPFSTLSELELNCDDLLDLTSEREVRAELRFSEDMLDIGKYDIQVALTQATLFVRASGSSIKPGSRLFERSRSDEELIVTKRRRALAKNACKSGANISGSLQNGASAGGSFENSKDSEEEVEIEIQQSVKNEFVRPTSGNRWIINESGKGNSTTPLEGTYIANDVLCRLVPRPNANTVSVEAMVLTRKKDVEVTPEGNPVQKEFRERVHKNKFMKAIIAQSLGSYPGNSLHANNRGTIVLSRSVLETDPDVS